jgi:hypothetical protein
MATYKSHILIDQNEEEQLQAPPPFPQPRDSVSFNKLPYSFTTAHADLISLMENKVEDERV